MPLKCYDHHLNSITMCALSNDKHYLVTASELDRCIIIWKIDQKKLL